MNLNYKNINIEREALFLMQRHHYQKKYTAYKMFSIPIRIHSFKAKEFGVLHFDSEYIDRYIYEIWEKQRSLYDHPNMGWDSSYSLETYFHTITVQGNHLSMMIDLKNQAILGKE